SMPTDRDVLDAILAEVRALRRQIQARPRSTLSRHDRAALTRLLPAIGGVFGSEVKTVREVVASGAPAIRVVLEALGLSPRSLGRLFTRADGIPIEGYLVRRDGEESHAGLWRVVGVSDVEKLLRVPAGAPDSRVMAAKE